MKKRHAKVYVISEEGFQKAMGNNLEGELEYSLAALDGVRAKCFSSADLEGVAEDDKGLDWEMNNALTETMMQTCDVVAVLGGYVSPQHEARNQTRLGTGEGNLCGRANSQNRRKYECESLCQLACKCL